MSGEGHADGGAPGRGAFIDTDLVTGRLFFAVGVPGAVRAPLEALRPELTQALPRARLTEASGWHLTLAFLGQVRAEHAADVVAVGEAAAAAAGGAASLRLDGAGAFPSAERARALWAGVAGDVDVLTGLAEALASASREAGLRWEERPFLPHLTLARLPEPQPVPEATVASVAAAAAAAPGWKAHRLSCYRSTLTNRGARYTVVMDFPLGRDGS